MKIIYKKGNLFDGDEKYIAHGCNAQGAMGSGFAGELKKRYPDAVNTYKTFYSVFGLKLGDVINHFERKNKVAIFHCITQETYGKTGFHVSYDAIRECMMKIDLRVQHDVHVAMPQIGSGLAGGDWNIIEKIIEENSNGFQPVVYIL